MLWGNNVSFEYNREKNTKYGEKKELFAYEMKKARDRLDAIGEKNRPGECFMRKNTCFY